MDQHKPSKVIGGTRYEIDVWEDTGNNPPWRWRVQKASRDKDGNQSGPWRDVASGAELTQEKARQAAAKQIIDEVNR